MTALLVIVVFAQFLDIVQGAAGDARELIASAGSQPESAVATSSGYFVSAMKDGTITKYDFDGVIMDGWAAISGLKAPRGLAVTADGSTLFAATDAGIIQYSLTSTSATETKTFDTLAKGLTKPNGLCLHGDGVRLFATQPGWKAFPWGVDESSGLAQINLSDGVITMLFQSSENQSPNGCTVVGNKVWLTNMKDGVSSYDLDSNIVSAASWAENIKTAQTSNQLAGDGMAFYDGKLYVSIWTPMGSGQIYKCAMVDACTEFASYPAADLQVDLHDPATPELLAPDLRKGKIRAIALAGEAQSAAIDTTAVTTSAGSTDDGTAVTTNSAQTDASGASLVEPTLVLCFAVLTSIRTSRSRA
eukprot:gnl/MRDRNA2_/MRDRNA2_62238_c0_seq1.p1 gnl/MRDRNA2_/MRDRNA2_62238_c0~~gnl/MRDRNA2_/MRDRNA2_62238_c0_seq1.p1  ORF type:complete len:360 (+),score=64.85 gnl/MRDRNA2_/MRDRNA2_62238_c0_seq1:145-1224(+)